jgi:hypothetical protein
MSLRLPLLAIAIAAAAPAHAAAPQDVYAQVSPSVWKVLTYDIDGLPFGQGSAVVIAPETLVTNCHVLAKAKRVAVRREKVTLDAKLEMWDPQRDVCQIKAAGLAAPAVALGDASKVAVGQNAYAIGNPKGLELTMSAGLVSSVRRDKEGRIILIQTSAAISGGSSGGGLFDERGTLIGLTTLGSVTGDAQNLNFAVPVDWIKELPQRHARLKKPEAAAAASAPASASGSAVAGACVGAGTLAPPANDPAVTDTSRLPNATDKMREDYRAFLSCPLPRAFAVSEGGRWWYAWSTKPRDTSAPVDPAQRAVWACEKIGSGRCFLFAVDNRIVYEPEAGKGP